MPDYLIIGQGIAGSLLAREILRRGMTMDIVDPGTGPSASSVAAGVFNPVTGKRCVRTWNDTTLLPFAKEYYEDFEQEVGNRVRFEKPIMRVFQNSDERDSLIHRSSDNEIYAGYIDRVLAESDVPGGVRAPFGAVLLNGGGYVDVSAICGNLRKGFHQNGNLIPASFDPADLEIEEEHAVWMGKTYREVVFCEGYHASNNPWFSSIPFRHAKGEILTITGDLPEDHIISSGIFILPVGDRVFKVGATYEWHHLNEETTVKGREELERKVAALVEEEFEITGQEAAVRPIAFDRAPVAGRHPELPRLSILNGFGSKGVLYAPYYGRALIEHLESGSAIDDKVSVATHWKPERISG